MFAKTAFNLFEIDLKKIFALTYNPLQAVGEGEALGGLCPKLRAGRMCALPSKVYPAVSFSDTLLVVLILDINIFAFLKELLIVPVGTMARF